jgi:hypothetical protein
MVVMDQMTRRIIGFAVHAGDLDGPAICRLFNRHPTIPIAYRVVFRTIRLPNAKTATPQRV